MDNYFHSIQTSVGAKCSGWGALLADYIVDLLGEPDAEDVENHLLDCHDCKQRYLTIFEIHGQARRARARRLAKAAWP